MTEMRFPLDKLVIRRTKRNLFVYKWYVKGFDKPIYENETVVEVGERMLFDEFPPCIIIDSTHMNILDSQLRAILEKN